MTWFMAMFLKLLDALRRRGRRTSQLVTQARERAQQLANSRALAASRKGSQPGSVVMPRQRRLVALPVDDLSALLDRQRDTRTTFPALAFVESALLYRPENALSLVEEDVLERALTQLRGLADTSQSPRLSLLDLQIRRQLDVFKSRRGASAANTAAEPEWEDTCASSPREFGDTVIEERI